MSQETVTTGRKSVISSILWLTIAELFFNLSGYLIHSSLGRILGPADYGRYALIVTLTTMIIMLIGNGIPTAMSKYISGVFEKEPNLVLAIKKQASRLQFVLIGIVTLIFFIGAPVIAKLLRDETLTPLLRISAFIIPSYAAASFYLYYYIGIHHFNLQSTMKIIRSFARVLFVIGMAYIWKLNGSVASYILSPATVFAAAWFIDRMYIDRQFPKDDSASFDWRKLLDYAWPVTLFMLFYEVLISLDLYLVKAILQDDALTGIYNASLTVARIPYYLFYALTMVMLPSISRTTAQGLHEETRNIISQTFRMMVMILVPILVLMFVYAGPLVRFFFGKQFLEATLSTQVLIPGAVFLTVFYVMSFALNGAGKVKIPMFVSFVGMILNALLNYMLINRFGIVGSAMATTITSFFITLVILYFVRKQFGKFILFSSLLKFLFAGLILYFISFLFPADNWLFIPWGFALSVIYVFLLLFLREFSNQDFQTFKQIIMSKKNKVAPETIKESD